MTSSGVTFDFTVTMTGSAQNLATLCLGNVVNDRPVALLELQPAGANNNPCYIGSSSALTSSLYGVRLEAGDTNDVPPAPYRATNDWSNQALGLGNYWILGTNNEVLHIFGQWNA
jgi:hypothetical protein